MPDLMAIARTAIADAVDAVERLPYGDVRDEALSYLAEASEVLEDVEDDDDEVADSDET